MAYAVKSGVDKNGDDLYFQHIVFGDMGKVNINEPVPQKVDTLEEAEKLLTVANIMDSFFGGTGQADRMKNYEIVEVE